MTIRPQDVLLYAGGECFQRFGVPFMRMTRSQDAAETVTRAGAVGPFVGKGGIRRASADRLRVDWLDMDGDGILDTPAFLAEPARTNLVTEDDLTLWGTVGTPVVSTTDGPDGGTSSAYTVEDDNASGDEYVTSPNLSAFGSGGFKGVVFVIRENTHPGGADVQTLVLRDTTAGAMRLDLWITGFTDGQPIVTENVGSLLDMRPVGHGYWALYGLSTSVTAVNTHQAWVTPTSSSDDVGSIDVYRVNVFDDFSLQSIVSASEVKAVETIDVPVGFPPQALTLYLKFRDGWLARAENANSGILASLGRSSGGGSGGFVRIDNGGGSNDYRVYFEGSATDTGEVNVGDGTDFVMGDVGEVAVQMDSSFGIAGGAFRVNAGAQVALGTAAGGGMPASWMNDFLRIESEHILAVKVATGARTLADMAALFAYDSARAVA